MRVIRRCDPGRDYDDLVRVWDDCAWFVTDGDDVRRRSFLDDGPVWVGEVDGTVHALAASRPGSMRYLDGDVPMALISAVNCSLVMRRRGLAGAATRALLADLAKSGTAVAFLGIFDQGYYDRLGFGTGPSEVKWSFDPGKIIAPQLSRPPVRIGRDDLAQIHAARLARYRAHGAINLHSPLGTVSDFGAPGEFGLGFRRADGTLGAHLWLSVTQRQMFARWLAFADRGELGDLFALIRTFGDQCDLFTLIEPGAVQVQAFLDTPIKQIRLTDGSSHPAVCRAVAWWQARILDLPACIAHLPPAPPFQLALTDPIGLVDGDWVIRDGTAARGLDRDLPVMRASVGAFTRLWMGVGDPRTLALTDDLHAPSDLVDALYRAVRLPQPKVDWDF